jgi:hypothetical protein
MPWDVGLGRNNLTTVIHEQSRLKIKFGVDIPVSGYYDRNTDKLSRDEK